MNSNNSSSLFQAAGIIALIFGIISAILLVGIPVIIGGTKFLKYAKYSNEECQREIGSILGWSIVLLIFSIIPGVLAIVGYATLPKTTN
ncbi:MAG: hypothetical protein FWF56_00865 [Firmicutes bacterium]|nr:hypothetical protein [Bacillota bacterium]